MMEYTMIPANRNVLARFSQMNKRSSNINRMFVQSSIRKTQREGKRLHGIYSVKY